MPRSTVTPLSVASLAFALLTCAGCATNVEPIAETKIGPVPESVVYQATLDRVWAAAAAALREAGPIRLLDRASTTMESEFHVVDARQLTLTEKALAGKTYSNNYSLSFLPVAADRTEVRVVVGLRVTQFGVESRVSGEDHVRSVLRQRLFDRIELNLGR